MSDFPPGARSPADRGTEMTTDEALAFLSERGHGVLSLAGDPPLSVPMSVAVLPGGRLLFQSLSGPDSQKAERLGVGVGATVVAHERSSPDDWASAVATGELAAVEWSSDRQEAFAEQAESVGLSVFRAEAPELEAEWYELQDATVTGRRGPSYEDPNKFGESR